MQVVSPRDRLVGYLTGAGIEVGPGHHPFPVLPFTSVRYVDRWNPSENRELFPELDGAEFPRPDIVADLDKDLLRALPDGSEDFVILSHVLEHLANPLALLTDVHRVLRPGGVVLILLPDRHRTFDRTRPPTPLAHTIADYESGATEVEDAHIEEFLLETDPETARDWIEGSAADRAKMIGLHRRRSIHVHCWDEEEFAAVLCYAVEHLGHSWELVDGVLSADGGAEAMEFGYILRRAVKPTPADEAIKRFADDLAEWRDEGPYRRALRSLHRAGADGTPLEQIVAAKDLEIARLRAEVQAIYATKLLRYTAPLRRAYRLLRRYSRQA